MKQNRKVILTVKTMTGNIYDIYEPKVDVVNPRTMKKKEDYDVWYKLGNRSVEKFTGKFIDTPETALTIEFEDQTRKHFDIIEEVVRDDNGSPIKNQLGEIIYRERKIPRLARISIPINNIIRCQLAG